VFSPDDTPFNSWLDIVLGLGLVAGYLALFIAVASRLPLYSYWEIRRSPVHPH